MKERARERIARKRGYQVQKDPEARNVIEIWGSSKVGAGSQWKGAGVGGRGESWRLGCLGVGQVT